MKYYSIFLVTTILFCACASQKEQTEVNKEAVAADIMEKHHQALKEINFKQQRLNIKEYKDGNWMNSDCNPQKFYSMYESLEDWREIDKELQRIYATYKEKDYFHAVAQNIAGRFLRQKLLVLNKDDEVVSKIAFYLDLLVSNESFEWEIISQSVAVLRESTQRVDNPYHQTVINKAKNYILSDGPESAVILEEFLAHQELKFREKEESENIKIDRSTTVLFNLKKVELEEIQEAVKLAQNW